MAAIGWFSHMPPRAADLKAIHRIYQIRFTFGVYAHQRCIQLSRLAFERSRTTGCPINLSGLTNTFKICSSSRTGYAYRSASWTHDTAPNRLTHHKHLFGTIVFIADVAISTLMAGGYFVKRHLPLGGSKRAAGIAYYPRLKIIVNNCNSINFV